MAPVKDSKAGKWIQPGTQATLIPTSHLQENLEGETSQPLLNINLTQTKTNKQTNKPSKVSWQSLEIEFTRVG